MGLQPTPFPVQTSVACPLMMMAGGSHEMTPIIQHDPPQEGVNRSYYIPYFGRGGRPDEPCR
jgi:hypothetical protein